MRRFSAYFRRLQSVSEDLGRVPVAKVFKFIPLLLSVPYFVASDFCFKRAYAINLRRMRKVGLDSALLRLYEGGLDLGDLAGAGSGDELLQRYQALRCRLKSYGTSTGIGRDITQFHGKSP